MKRIVLIAVSGVVLYFVFLMQTDNEQAEITSIPTKSIEQSSVKAVLPPEINIKAIASNVINNIVKQNETISAEDVDAYLEQFYVVDCPAPPPLNENQRLEKFNNHINSLENSDDPEKQLLYAVASHDYSSEGRAQQLDLVLNFTQRNPQHKLSHFLATTLCLNRSNERCNDTLMQQAVELDGNNGAMWFNKANYHIQQGDFESAVVAMEKASSSLEFDDYIYQQVNLIEQGLLGSEISEFKHRIGFGFGHTQYPLNPDIIDFCQENLLDHADGCLRLGQTMTKQSKSLSIQYTGVAIQKTVLEYRKQYDEARKLDIEQYFQHLLFSSDLFVKAGILIDYDEKFARHWFEDFRINGEMESFVGKIREAILLSKNEDYNPCPVD